MMSFLKKIGYTNIIIVLMQLCMYPYLFFYYWGLPDTNIMAVVFLIIILLLCFVKRKRRGGVPTALVAIMIVQSIVWFLYFVLYFDSSYLVRIFFIVLTYLSLLLLSNDDSVIRFSNVYNYTILVQGILGTTAFFLIFFGVLNPISSVVYNEFGGYYEFYGLTFVKVHFDNFVRINGYFDEPGAFAFWGMFALLFNKLIYNNRRMEVILLISLLFTFSSAYFILLPLYFLLFYRNRLKSGIRLIVLLVPLAFLAVHVISNNDGFLKYTVERFEGGRVESSRYEHSDFAKKLFMSSPVIGVGAQNLEVEYGNVAFDNPYEILAKDGIVGCFFTYLPIFFLIFKYSKNGLVWSSVIILSLNYLQRPFHMNEMHYLMLYLFCFLVIKKYGSKNGNLRRESDIIQYRN